MSLPLCEICREQAASILICFEHHQKTERHHVCANCVSEIAEGELANLLNYNEVDFAKLKALMHQWQGTEEPDSEESATLQKLQAMMGEDGETNLDAWADDEIEKVLFKDTGENTSTSPQCPACHTSWKNIHEDGLVGCPHCYISFAAQLQNVMEELHHNTAHTGKIPRLRQKQERMKEHQQKQREHREEMLQRRLEAAVQAEEYEEAAQIRDKIAQISEETK
jgi:protein-arginine kinase activator protein McsA